MDAWGYPVALVHANSHDAAGFLELLAARLKEAPGYGLITLSVPEPAGVYLQRIYTRDPVEYPLGQADRVQHSPWFDQLFQHKSPIVANSKEEIACWLPHFQGFEGTDYGGLLNYPIVVADETIGILNLAGRQGCFPMDAGEMIASELALAAMAIGSYSATWRTNGTEK